MSGEEKVEAHQMCKATVLLKVFILDYEDLQCHQAVMANRVREGVAREVDA